MRKLNKNGFTLIEMLIVVAIIGALVLIFVPKSDLILTETKLNTQKVNSAQLETASSLYFNDNNTQPTGSDISTTVSPETISIINNMLKENNSSLTFTDLKNNHSLKTLNSSNLKPYLKNAVNLNDYFIVSDGLLMGRVFTYKVIQDKNKEFYSGRYHLVYDLSTDSTVELPSLGNGSSGNPYIIKTVGQLQAIDKCGTCYYELGNDIDASGTSSWNGGKGFIPIGYTPYATDYFSGHFDGKGYSIKNLYMNDSTNNYVSLFSVLNSGSVVQNVKIENANITGLNYLGILSGFVYNGATIKNSSVSGSVKGTNSSSYVGGLLYYNGGTIENSSSNANVEGGMDVGGLVSYNDGLITNSSSFSSVKQLNSSNNSAGGLVGYNSSSATIENSKTNATIVNEGAYTGGFVGLNKGTITTSSSNSTTEAHNDYVGGFVGLNFGTIKESYSIGLVKQTTGECSGGFVGWASSDSSGVVSLIQNTYSKTAVNGISYVSSFIGCMDAPYSNTTNFALATGSRASTDGHIDAFVGGYGGGSTMNAFWNKDVIGNVSEAGSSGKTTAELKMQSTYTGWDFVNIWATDPTINEGYPYLKNNIPN